ncbi:hypothetical protein V5N11_029184 [Cardamine amara subsp. amara]|uniref:Retrotransposon gag domain-containing protein n=1 Tax=Cardamine amara subsp. amara TaxID=228776 RepID=A0ABD1BIK2_CARAN
MAPKADPTKNTDAVEKAVDKLQRDVEKLLALESSVNEMKLKMDILDRIEKKMMDDERREVAMGKQREGTHTSGVNESQIEGSQSRSNQKPIRSVSLDDQRMEMTRELPKANESLTKKIEAPIFDGENVESWVVRVEQYFELSNFTEEDKLKVVRMCFDGDALTWYRWERDRNPFMSWEHMKHRALENFSPAQDLTPGERLLLLRQEGSAVAYCREFIALASNAPEVPENVLEMAFMAGLKPKTRAGVKMFNPRNLQMMMNKAKMVEEWNETEESPSSNLSHGTNRSGRVAGGNSQSYTRGDQLSGGGANWSKPRNPNNSEAHTTPFRPTPKK